MILRAPVPAPMRLLVPAHRLSTAGLLPPRLRHEYGVHWSPLHELALSIAAGTARITTKPALIVASRIAPAAALAA